MAKEFLPLFLDFNETTQDLDDAQCGRLVRALVNYANGGDIEYDLQGMELMAFRFLKGSIDRNRRLSAVRADAGSKGGFAKAEKQTVAKDSKRWQAVAKDGKSININNDINNKINSDINNDSLLDDDEAHRIQVEQNRVLDAAADAGFPNTNNVRAALIALYAEYSLDRLLEGIKSCSEHSAVNLAYLRAVLKGGNKPVGKPVKVLPAQDFEQRSYDGVNDEIMRDLKRQMDEFHRTGEVG